MGRKVPHLSKNSSIKARQLAVLIEPKRSNDNDAFGSFDSLAHLLFRTC